MKYKYANYQYGVFSIASKPLKDAQPVSDKDIMEAAANMDDLKLMCKIEGEDVLAAIETAIYYHDAVA